MPFQNKVKAVLANPTRPPSWDLPAFVQCLQTGLGQRSAQTPSHLSGLDGREPVEPLARHSFDHPPSRPMKKNHEKLDLNPAHTAWAELDAALGCVPPVRNCLANTGKQSSHCMHGPTGSATSDPNFKEPICPKCESLEASSRKDFQTRDAASRLAHVGSPISHCLSRGPCDCFLR